MSDQGSTSFWLERLVQGDPEAAQQIWERYYVRLVGLAHKKLRDVSRRVADEDDVVINAFDSFCRGAAAGRFPRLQDRDDLWQILVLLTSRKAANQRKHQLREKRGGGQVRGDSVFGDHGGVEEHRGLDEVSSGEPTPEFACEVAEACQQLLARLGDETLRGIALGKLEGSTNQEIADQLGCKERTVERKLQLIRKLWSDEG